MKALVAVASVELVTVDALGQSKCLDHDHKTTKVNPPGHKDS